MTTAGLFSPRSPDGRAEWRVIYEDLIAKMKPGDVITHDQILEALERPRDERFAGYRAIARASKETRRRRRRSLAVVPGVGYKMLAAGEHETQAEVFYKQASRRMWRGVEELQSADLSDLTAAQRERTIAATMVFQGMAAALDNIAERQRRTEQALSTVNQRLTALEDEK